MRVLVSLSLSGSVVIILLGMLTIMVLGSNITSLLGVETESVTRKNVSSTKDPDGSHDERLRGS